MADTIITKIRVRSRASADLPEALDVGEPAYSTDEGRMFIGSDPSVGQPQYNRTTFPYQNIEILTENSTELFNKLHGDRMREGGGVDYYSASLLPMRYQWTSVIIPRDGTPEEYRIHDIASVAAFIDYAVADTNGVPVRMGRMQLTHFDEHEAAPHLMDNGMVRRNLALTYPANGSAQQVAGKVQFRFKVAGPINARYLAFQYRNISDTWANLRFKVSRPEAVFYDGEPIIEENIFTKPPVVLPPPVEEERQEALGLRNVSFEEGPLYWDGIITVGTSHPADTMPRSGTQYAWAGENAMSQFHQTVPVEHLATMIDAGKVTITDITVWHMSNASQDDFGRLFITFYDAMGEEIVTAYSPRNTVKVYENLRVPDMPVPVRTRSIRIGAVSTRTQGDHNDNYWDDFSQPILIIAP